MLAPALYATIGDINGATVLYAYDYVDPVPTVGDTLWLFVHDRDLRYHDAKDDLVIPKDMGERYLIEFKVIGRTFHIHRTPQQIEPRCTEITLFVQFVDADKYLPIYKEKARK